MRCVPQALSDWPALELAVHSSVRPLKRRAQPDERFRRSSDRVDLAADELGASGWLRNCQGYSLPDHAIHQV
jgi:hypothetical protein